MSATSEYRSGLLTCGDVAKIFQSFPSTCGSVDSLTPFLLIDDVLAPQYTSTIISAITASMYSALIMSPTILFENTNVIIINKPASLVVHPDGRTDERTLVDWITETHPEMKGVGEPLTLQSGEVIDRPGIVHRLDRETSGVMVIAKNQDAFLFLKSQFQNREAKKIYNAFVYGNFKETEGVIDRPIGRSASDFRRWSAQRGAKGEMREAVTEYTVLKSIKGFSCIEARPKTGRTHQIRVHMKAINHPVVCDKLYAANMPTAFGFERLALHARSLTLTLPDGEVRTFEAPLPEDFQNALTQFNELHEA